MIEIKLNTQEVDFLLMILEMERIDMRNSNKTNLIVNNIMDKITEKVNE